MKIKKWWRDRKENPVFWHQLRAIKRNVKIACEAATPMDYDFAIQGHLPSVDGKAPIILACCDQVYFYRFARQLAASMKESNRICRMHIHIFQPTPSCIADAEILEASMAGRLSISYEMADRNAYQDPSAFFFASGRFAVANRLANRNHVPILVIDADTIVRQDLAPALAALGDADVGLTMRQERPFPWRKILAGAVYIGPTESGRLFASRLATALQLSLAKAPAYHVDQTTLYFLFEYYRRNRLKLEIRDLGLKWGDYTFSKDSLIWSAKGKLKLAFADATPGGASTDQ